MLSTNIENVKKGYDLAAEEYAKALFKELENKPLDRVLLNRFAGEMKHKEGIYDFGCGPGETTFYLYNQGLTNIVGVDISPEMITQAKQLSPQIRYETGNMFNTKLKENSLSGIVAFYAIVNFSMDEVNEILKEFFRILNKDGKLFIAFHSYFEGKDQIQTEDLFGKKINPLLFYFFKTEEMVSALKSTGFEMEDIIMRYPYPGVEFQSQRTYLFAIKK